MKLVETSVAKLKVHSCKDCPHKESESAYNMALNKRFRRWRCLKIDTPVGVPNLDITREVEGDELNPNCPLPDCE